MQQTRQYIAQRLSPIYQGDELNALIWWILEELTRKNRAILLTMNSQSIFPQYQHRIEKICDRLIAHEPIQYIFGHTWWSGLDLITTPDVLIPRPETAQILNIAAAELTQPPATILDLCTGSGCIAIALKQLYRQAHVYGADISQQALIIAKQNTERNKVGAITFEQHDVLHTQFQNYTFKPDCTFDLIVSNPPYIADNEKKDIAPNVLDYEPQNALFVPGDDPLIFYRAIASYANTHLNSHGLLIVEINQRLPQQTQQLIQQLMPHAEVKTLKDDYGNWRFITAHQS